MVCLSWMPTARTPAVSIQPNKSNAREVMGAQVHAQVHSYELHSAQRTRQQPRRALPNPAVTFLAWHVVPWRDKAPVCRCTPGCSTALECTAYLPVAYTLHRPERITGKAMLSHAGTLPRALAAVHNAGPCSSPAAMRGRDHNGWYALHHLGQQRAWRLM